ncbi:Uncharacterized protein PCOAH_00015380 [Plasmodium coatneyi]|uniref:Plasmodium RESA N-terminal domain-containing protein n=1 Tax=Plasmodium coatneyi TaxID=208452 RepID=A0A1B1DWX9_9APIC|nr:Uncharacterized protein PCOAH_00015380 [Plasmodium coatneyi]ANQ07139.1 Uncharacterized protein PCOAH_00015380 [Plasmodium coatneyi]
MAVRSSESGVGAKKSTPGSFFTKRTAMLFFVAAYIFLKHQDDFASQNAAATLQVSNRIARNLKANTETAPSEEELEYYEDGDENHGDGEEAYEDPEEAYESHPEEAYESHPQEISKHHPEEMYEEYEEEGYSNDEQEEEVSEEEDEERPAEKEEEVREEVYPQEESIVEHDDAREENFVEREEKAPTEKEENSAEREVASEGEQAEQPAQYVQEEEDDDDSISGSQSNVTSCWKCFKRTNKNGKKKKKKEKKEDAPVEREEEGPVEREEDAPVEREEDAPVEREEEAPVEREEEAPVEREEGTAEGGRYLKEEEEKMVHEGAYFYDVPKEQVSQEVAEGAQVNEHAPEGERQYVDEGREMGGGEGAPNVQQEVEQPAEQPFPLFGERTNYVVSASICQYPYFVNTYMNAYSDDKEEQKRKKEIKEEKTEEELLKEKKKSEKKLNKRRKKVYNGPLGKIEEYEDQVEEERKRSLKDEMKEQRKKMEKQNTLCSWDENKFHMAGYEEIEYLEEIAKARERSLRRGKEEYIDDEDEMNKLLFGELNKLENYGTHKNSSFCYEMSCFDERLSDYEINKELKEMDKFPKKYELISLYWQSFLNERSKYINANKRLFKKFLELKKKQNFETISGYKNKWKKCSKIVGNNFKEQREHVNDIFYTSVVKENLSRDEFKEILKDVRDSWKEVTLKVTDECTALLEEPIVPEVKIIYYHPYDGTARFRVTRLSSPHPSS